MANELTKASLDGNSVKVPIGAPVITNKRDGNSTSIKALMTGQQVTLLQMQTIEALGYDGKQIGRNSATNEFDFVTPEVANAEKSVQWSFDRESGQIVFVRDSGEVVTISGFLRQIDFGVGPQGPRGNPGKDGEDAEDGRDGKDGDTGCAGTTGADGRGGEVGDYGEEGPVGPDGLTGAPGPTGPTGIIGPQGIPGREGKRGPKGFSCPTTLIGPDGPQGREMNKYVGMNPAPGAVDLIWAAPEDCLCAFDPTDPEFVDGVNIYAVSTITLIAPDLLCPAGQTVFGVVGGPTTASGTYTESVMSDGSIQRSAYNYNGAYCAVATTSEPHVIITEKYVPNSTQVTKQISKTNPNEAWYFFYEGGKLVHKVRRVSANGAFNYTAADPDIREDGMKFWQGALQTTQSDASWNYYIYTYAGSFTV